MVSDGIYEKENILVLVAQKIVTLITGGFDLA